MTRAGRLLVASVVAGSLVAALSAVTGVPHCAALGSGDDCRALVRTLSINVGAMAAVVTAVMALFVAGLGRMWRQDEEDRRERRLEGFRASTVQADDPGLPGPRRVR